MSASNAEVALVNLDPTLQLLGIGALLAAVPLVWWAWQQRNSDQLGKLRALVAITLFLTFDLVLFGAFTRLTDSGLGCPDWPGCYGSASPIGAKAEILAAEVAQPGGPVTLPKAWIEMIHRKAATGIGALITLIALLGFAWRKTIAARFAAEGRSFSPWWGVGVLVWVCAQGAFGALTVTLKLQPLIVTLHLMGGIGLLMVLAALQVYYKNSSNKHNGYMDTLAILPKNEAFDGLRKLLWLSFALVWVQVALGGWVSTNYAVVACMEFPTCQGIWWPAMQLQEGFSLWRQLGKSSSGASLSFDALVGIHYVHRLAAYLLFAVVGWAAWQAWKSGHSALRTSAKWLAALLLWQLATGLGNVLLGWPLLAAVAHTGGAAGLVVVLSFALMRRSGANASASAEKIKT